ncbi:MAG: tetratricopeptide repeat protein [Sandaracinaceae bacterium]
MAALFALGLANGVAHADPPRAQRVDRARARVAERPGDLESQLALAVELIRAGRPDAALAELEVLEALAPAHGGAAYWRARALSDAGRPAEAEDALAHALDARELALRGELREERGARELALEDYQAALSQEPTIEVERRAAQLRARLGRTAEAADVLELAVRRTGSAVLRAEAAELARRAGRSDAALAHVDALLAAGDAVRWRVLRAAILHEAGREAEAREALERAAALADARVERRVTAMALTERARVREARGDLPGARADLAQASRLAPSWVVPRRLLAAMGGAR